MFCCFLLKIIRLPFIFHFICFFFLQKRSHFKLFIFHGYEFAVPARVSNTLLLNFMFLMHNIYHANRFFYPRQLLKWENSMFLLSPVFDGSNVHNCFFFKLAPFAFSLYPNVSAVMYLWFPLIKPIVHQPFCWFCDRISPFVWIKS